MKRPRPVFVISDHTGLTAEALSRSLLTQFDELDTVSYIRPFITTTQKARELLAEIAAVQQRHGVRPLIFSTLANPELNEIIGQADAFAIDLFRDFLPGLSVELGAQPQVHVGHYRGLRSYRERQRYQERIDALEFALATDDGLGEARYADADFILVGVSRTGKTPTCLYLALQHGARAANHPITDEYFDRVTLPASLLEQRRRLHGLTIHPQRLHEIRSARREGSSYASMERCRFEVTWAARQFRREDIPVIDVSTLSVEEIASTLIARPRGEAPAAP